MKKVFLFATTLGALVACGGSTAPTHTIPAKVHFVNGATPLGMSPSPGDAGRPAASPPSAPPTNGIWALSPDKVSLTAKRVYLDGDSAHSEADVSCTATYDRAKPSLSALSDCAFQVVPGTYTSVQFDFDDTLYFTFADTTNGFYSTAASIVTSAPVGGVVPMRVVIPNGFPTFAWRTPLPSPLVVTDTTVLSSVSVVLDASQTFGATVSGGTVTPDPYGVGVTTPRIVVTVGTVGAFEIYGGPGVTSTASLCYAGACNVPFNRLIVAYSSATTPVTVGLPIVSTASCNGDAGGLYISDLAHSYLGLDAAGDLGWAESGDKSSSGWNGYSALWRISRQSTVGGTATLYCASTTTDPNPAGGSFASGAPNIASPGNAVATYTLIAH